MDKNRLGAFSDAILAIAATIMVLDLQLPKEPTLQSLANEWSVFLAYLISFVFIYIVRLSYHNLFKEVERISLRTFLINGVWIFWLTLVPFTTNWLGSNPFHTWPNVIYDIVILLGSGAFQLMERSVKVDNPKLSKQNFAFFDSYLRMYLVYFIGIVLAFILPISNIIIILLTTLIYSGVSFKNNKIKRSC